MGHIAVVGCGQWGKNFVRNFAELEVLRVACDANDAQRMQISRQFPSVTVRTSFFDVLEDKGVEGVVIATPASSHYSMAKSALLAGKDVFVEKPLALRVTEGRELVELAAANGKILMVGHLLRYHQALIKLKALIDDGGLGRLNYIYSNRLNLGRFRKEENILFSFAPHDISAILYLLGEMPTSVSAGGGSYLSPGVADVTVTTLEFRSGVRGHIFVSWLHPYKEQRFVVVGDKRMAVFDDAEGERRLVLLNHEVEWVNRTPVPRSEESEVVHLPFEEPLRTECQHFLDCIRSRTTPHTDGLEGLQVLEVLEACQRSLDQNRKVVPVPGPGSNGYSAHETAVIDEPCEIGHGTKIWHFSHVMKGARVGKNCNIGQNVFIASHVVIGDNVKIQNNVSIYDGVTLEDHVFCGPSVVFTNVYNPRSQIRRMNEIRPTVVRRGATLGANCTVVCGVTIGRYAFVGAGAVVITSVPDFALVVGNPARVIGWMCVCGNRINGSVSGHAASCRTCDREYSKTDDGLVLTGRNGVVEALPEVGAFEGRIADSCWSG